MTIPNKLIITDEAMEIAKEIVGEIYHDFNISDEGKRIWKLYLGERIQLALNDAEKRGMEKKLLANLIQLITKQVTLN
jgi:hypothetical protein